MESKTVARLDEEKCAIADKTCFCNLNIGNGLIVNLKAYLWPMFKKIVSLKLSTKNQDVGIFLEG